jgi:hypothetical protein
MVGISGFEQAEKGRLVKWAHIHYIRVDLKGT